MTFERAFVLRSCRLSSVLGFRIWNGTANRSDGRALYSRSHCCRWDARSTYPISACFYAANPRVKRTRVTTTVGVDEEGTDAAKSGDNRATASANAALQHIGVRPTMTLLLGVLYFACRWTRSGVIANDVVQLARDDDLPWFSAWSRMPDALRSPLGLVAKFFRPNALPKSPATVVFLAESFAMRIGCRMPALNAPAIAMRATTAMFTAPEQVIHNFVSLLYPSRGGSPLTLPNLDSEARVLALLTVAAAMVHVHDAQSGGQAESTNIAIISRPVKVPWSRADLEACSRADLRTYATFLRHALDNPSVESRMTDTCGVLRTWAQEIDDSGGAHVSDRVATARPLSLRANPTLASWFVRLVERASEYLGCEPCTLARLVDELIQTRPCRPRSKPPREGPSIVLAKLQNGREPEPQPGPRPAAAAAGTSTSEASMSRSI